jgi:hypothetical protein
MIGKIESDGVWLLDTNFGSAVYLLATDGIDPTHMEDPNRPGHFLTRIEAESRGLQFAGTHYKQYDNTIRYHKMLFANLDDSIVEATIYRITVDKNGSTP